MKKPLCVRDVACVAQALLWKGQNRSGVLLVRANKGQSCRWVPHGCNSHCQDCREITSSPYLARKDVLYVQKGVVASWAPLAVGQVTEAVWFPVSPNHHRRRISARRATREQIFSDPRPLFLLRWHRLARGEGCPVPLPLLETTHTPPGPNRTSHWRCGDWSKLVTKLLESVVRTYRKHCSRLLWGLKQGCCSPPPFPSLLTHRVYTRARDLIQSSMESSAWSLFNWALCVCVNIIPILSGYLGKH